MDQFPPDCPRITTYTYDAEGRLITIQNARGDVTTMACDAADQRDCCRTTYMYFYDAEGHRTAAFGSSSPAATMAEGGSASIPASAPAPVSPPDPAPAPAPAAAPPVLIELGPQALRVPAAQRLWVEGRGWTLASDLVAGDRLRTDDGRVMVVTRLTAS